jgi:putative transposase
LIFQKLSEQLLLAAKVAVSALVNSLKGASSRILRKRYPEIAAKYYKDVLWSPSYFAASCGGDPISIIWQYVEQQQALA